MTIGIDISQIVHEGTGVASYVRELTRALLSHDRKNSYVLFGTSLRKMHILSAFVREMAEIHPNVTAVLYPIPPTALSFIWNTLHIIPIEWFTGPLDIFWSSDWTQPPVSHAHAVTTIHDVSFLTVGESFHQTIRAAQQKRLYWVKRQCEKIFCDSQATARDVVAYLGIPKEKTTVVYPGMMRYSV